MDPSTSRMMKKRNRASVDAAVVDICRREVGHLSTRKFAHRLAASEDLVLRLDLLRKLEKHRGCVNTVSFNADGDILVSGSDDRRVILWDWETGRVKLSFNSGHNNNIFQAKIMPETDERSIVTCAADGQVRHATILDCGKVETKLLARHQGRAHKLANEPGSPHIFYTCGEDGLVQHVSHDQSGYLTLNYIFSSVFDLRTGEATELFSCQPVRGRSFLRVVNLNAIAIDPRNPNLFVIAGSDEFTRLYDIRRYRWDASAAFGKPADHFCPKHLLGDENVGITGLAFSDQSELLVSYCEEFIYLFSKDMGWGSNVNEILDNHLSVGSDSDMETDSILGPQLYKGHRNCVTVKGVSFFGPKCEYVVSGSDCGRMFIWRKKDGALVRVMEADKQVVNCIQAHPHTTMLASSGIDRDIKIWTPTALEKAPPPTNIEKLRPKTNSWMYQMVSPRDMALQLLAMRSQQTSPERRRTEDTNAEGNMLEFILTFDANSSDEDDSEDEEGHDRFY
ncbi:WD40 repeat-containing protein [Cynara cardunculus var. scolymus]|uniref:WD40 repeat-containing protein n=1 Tax=Cynara cardunculus var. scolymus TaxID=59895 RepID=A0A124SAN1_CYNCS|nr:WD40 repeat-containing protein [Cynara cardunculus var. scolymus]